MLLFWVSGWREGKEMKKVLQVLPMSSQQTNKKCFWVNYILSHISFLILFLPRIFSPVYIKWKWSQRWASENAAYHYFSTESSMICKYSPRNFQYWRGFFCWRFFVPSESWAASEHGTISLSKRLGKLKVTEKFNILTHRGNKKSHSLLLL